MCRPTVRVFGTVMVSFPGAFVTQLQDPQDPREELRFTIQNAGQLKSVHPNKKLIPDQPPLALPQDSLSFGLNKAGLAAWVAEQVRTKPGASFYNVDVSAFHFGFINLPFLIPCPFYLVVGLQLVRYELAEGYEAPLILASYWKNEPQQTDLRIDYSLNPSESSLQNPLINVGFETAVGADLESFQSDPAAKW